MSKPSETSRIEAFSDGVFAVAITLLIFDVHAPPSSAGPLGHALVRQWPSYVAFLISFAFIGIMWVNHHRLFNHIRRSDNRLMFLNLLLLLGVTSVPFPTALLAAHYTQGDRTIAAAVFNGTYVAIAIFFNILWRHAVNAELLDPGTLSSARSVSKQYAVGPISYLICFALTWVSVPASLALNIGLAIFFAIPPKTSVALNIALAVFFAVPAKTAAEPLLPLLHAQSSAAIPPEVHYKHGYINPVPKPPDFSSAMPWGIAIADTRLRGYETAQVEIAHTQLSCRVDGKDIMLNDDAGGVRGGLYRRHPWFGTDVHDPIPLAYSADHRSVILKVGTHADRVWHFWAASPRAPIPPGKLAGCTVKARVRISRGALLQVGFDYWRNSTVDYGPGGNNHEAGASNWYFPSSEWQQVIFTDIRH